MRERRWWSAAPTPSLPCWGSAIAQPGSFTMVGGSFWQHTVVLAEPLIDPEGRLRTLCHTVPDRWMMEGIGFYCGLVMRWFRDAFCDLEVAEARARGCGRLHRAGTQARSRCHREPTACSESFSNLMQANRWVHASPGFVGFDISDARRSGRAECFRAIEESAAYVSRGHLGIVKELIDCRGAARPSSPAARPRAHCGRRSSPMPWRCRSGSRRSRNQRRWARPSTQEWAPRYLPIRCRRPARSPVLNAPSSPAPGRRGVRRALRAMERAVSPVARAVRGGAGPPAVACRRNLIKPRSTVRCQRPTATEEQELSRRHPGGRRRILLEGRRRATTGE